MNETYHGWTITSHTDETSGFAGRVIYEATKAGRNKLRDSLLSELKRKCDKADKDAGETDRTGKHWYFG